MDIPYIVLKISNIYYIWYIFYIRKKRTFLAEFFEGEIFLKVVGNKENVNQIRLTHKVLNVRFNCFMKPLPYTTDNIDISKPKTIEIIFKDSYEIEALIDVLEKFKKSVLGLLENGDNIMTNKEQNNLSKYIALILRHRPDVVGITLDEHGWANVSDLLEGINKTQTITMKMLEKIVEEDSKQRYSFNREKTLIRANQGHSIKVDVELKECMPPDILYHGTGVKYCSSINKQGLISKSRLYVHLSKDIETATNVGSRHGEPFIYKVRAKDMYNDGYKFFLSQNGVWLTKEVPICYLEGE